MRATRPGGAGRGGFTLVEVLAAISMIAVLLPVILYGANLASSAAATARARTQASILAKSKLDELLVDQSVAPLQAGAGDFGDRWPAYKWSAEVDAWNSPVVQGLTATIEQMTVTVTWQQGGEPRSVALTTLVYQSSGGAP